MAKTEYRSLMEVAVALGDPTSIHNVEVYGDWIFERKHLIICDLEECFTVNYKGVRKRRPMHFTAEEMLERLRMLYSVDGEVYMGAHFSHGHEGRRDSFIWNHASQDQLEYFRRYKLEHSNEHRQAQQFRYFIDSSDPEWVDRTNRVNRDNYAKYMADNLFRENYNKHKREYMQSIKDNDPERYEALLAKRRVN